MGRTLGTAGINNFSCYSCEISVMFVQRVHKLSSVDGLDPYEMLNTETVVNEIEYIRITFQDRGCAELREIDFPF